MADTFATLTPSPMSALAGVGMSAPIVPPVVVPPPPPIDEDDDQLTVLELCRMFEDAEEATMDARRDAERDRDFHDNKQWTSEELKVLRKRRQPAYVDNRIKSKIDFLVGLEKQQRIDPNVLPRTPAHEQDADGMKQALKYVTDSEQYDYKRSAVWRNMLVEGAGGISVTVKETRTGVDIKLQRVAWDRMFWDPASSELDFSDAGYIGQVVWKDYADALAMYPDCKDELTTTLTTSSYSDTYDDKPKYTIWGDRKRKRVRICQMWLKRADAWYFVEFTKGGILKAGPSWIEDDQGDSVCPDIFQSAYCDRDNNRFGLCREMIALQEAINKSGSKSQHLLNTSQVVALKGAVDDVEKARREAARPDGYIEVNPVADGPVSNAFSFNTRTDLAQSHFLFWQDAKNSIDLKGPNATQMGNKAGGSASASGKAIIASQQGGSVALGDLLDSLRHLDLRVFRMIYYCVRKYWTSEKWIRVTDDEQNIKWVGLNVDPMMLQQIMQSNPEAAQKIAGSIGNVAELDCDIIIEPGPEGPQQVQEQFDALVAMKQMDVKGEIPFKSLIRALPNPRVKAAILKDLEEAQQQSQEAQMKAQLEMAHAQATVLETQKNAELKAAQAQKALADAGKATVETQLAPMEAQHDAALKQEKHHQDAVIRALDLQERSRHQDSDRNEQQRLNRMTAFERQQERDQNQRERQADRDSKERQMFGRGM